MSNYESWQIDKNPLKVYCPRVDCQWVHDLERVPETKLKINCECGYDFCAYCKEPWHEKNCNEANRNLKAYFRKRKSKWCPKCWVRIEKNEGCNHMKCSNCGTDFCWVCGKLGSYHKDCEFVQSSCKGILCLLICLLFLPLIVLFLLPLMMGAFVGKFFKNFIVCILCFIPAIALATALALISYPFALLIAYGYLFVILHRSIKNMWRTRSD